MLSNYYLEMRAPYGFDSELPADGARSRSAPTCPTPNAAAPYLYLLDTQARADGQPEQRGSDARARRYTIRRAGSPSRDGDRQHQRDGQRHTRRRDGHATCVDMTPFTAPGPGASSCGPLGGGISGDGGVTGGPHRRAAGTGAGGRGGTARRRRGHGRSRRAEPAAAGTGTGGQRARGAGGRLAGRGGATGGRGDRRRRIPPPRGGGSCDSGGHRRQRGDGRGRGRSPRRLKPSGGCSLRHCAGGRRRGRPDRALLLAAVDAARRRPGACAAVLAVVARRRGWRSRRATPARTARSPTRRAS